MSSDTENLHRKMLKILEDNVKKNQFIDNEFIHQLISTNLLISTLLRVVLF